MEQEAFLLEDSFIEDSLVLLTKNLSLIDKRVMDLIYSPQSEAILKPQKTNSIGKVKEAVS